MKKTTIILLLIIGTYQLKAQQLLQVKPADSLSVKLLDKYLKGKIDSQLNFRQLQLNYDQTFSAIRTQKVNIFDQPIDRMPVVVLKGHDNMQIVNLAGRDNMNAVKIKPMDSKKLMPSAPTFNKP